MKNIFFWVSFSRTSSGFLRLHILSSLIVSRLRTVVEPNYGSKKWSIVLYLSSLMTIQISYFLHYRFLHLNNYSSARFFGQLHQIHPFFSPSNSTYEFIRHQTFNRAPIKCHAKHFFIIHSNSLLNMKKKSRDSLTTTAIEIVTNDTIWRRDQSIY